MTIFSDVWVHKKKVPPECWNDRFPFREVAIFGRLGGWGTVFSPPAKRPATRSRNNHFSDISAPENRLLPKDETDGFLFANWQFLDVSESDEPSSRLRRNGRFTVHEMPIFPTFRYLKTFPPERWNGQVPVRYVTIFWLFGAWEVVFCPPPNGWLTVHEMIILSDVSAPKKCFLPDDGTAGYPFLKWPILDVSELEEPCYRFRRNRRFTVRKITIFCDVSIPERCYLATAKRPGSRSRSEHFWKFLSRPFRRKREYLCIFTSGETAGLQFVKWQFFPTFRN